MAKLNVVKRITKEDFDDKDKPLIEKLAFPINQFMEQVVAAFNKNLTIEDNLAQEIKTFTTDVAASGVPNTLLQFKTSLKARGIAIVRAENVEDDTALTSAPFAQFTINNNIITITRILGLPANIDFSLTVLVYG